jgi:hypothetical protein
MRLARAVIAESGLGGRFWFKTACAWKDAHVTYKQQLGQYSTESTPAYTMTSRMFQDSAHSDAGLGSTSAREVNHICEQRHNCREGPGGLLEKYLTIEGLPPCFSHGFSDVGRLLHQIDNNLDLVPLHQA